MLRRPKVPPSGWMLLAVGALLLPSLPVPAQAPGAAADVAARVETGLVLGNATFFLGRFSLGVERLADPGLVGGRGLELPPGTLLVCPIEPGQGGAAARLAADPQGDCGEGESHRDPGVTFGNRTWLQFAGNFTPGPPPATSLSVIASRTPRGPLWAFLPGPEPVAVVPEDEEWRFVPVRASSQVFVEADGTRATYNGTEWEFRFTGRGEVGLLAAGIFAGIPRRVPFELLPGDPLAVEEVLDPRALLDLQEAVLGADEREPVANVTRHFRYSRIPALVTGSLSGPFDGTMGDLDLRGEPVVQAHFPSLRGNLSDGRLAARGVPDLVLYGGGVAIGGKEADDPPWTLATVLWVLALLALALGRRWEVPPLWMRLVPAALGALTLLLWDLILRDALGVSALSMLLDEATPLPVALRLTVFELIAFALTWLLLFLPPRTLLRRTLPGRLRLLSGAFVWPLFLVYLWLSAGSVIATGLLVARL